MKRLGVWMSIGAVMLLLGSVSLSAARATPSDAPPVYLPLVARGLGSPTLGGCAMFPPDNAWNLDISNYPLHSNSANFIADIDFDSPQNPNHFLHADFGETVEYGIPFVIVPGTQAFVPITYTLYGDESDAGPFPIPADAPVEGGASSGGDRHVLVLNSGNCTIYELYRAFKDDSGPGWFAESGAKWPLNTNALRPEGWTSADAAGLPILPGLVRYDEVAAGVIRHALRFTVWRTQHGYILPATHYAGNTPSAPPMGLRLRLKASYDISAASPQAKVILQALKTYGMIVADNGSSWFISGAYNPGWDDNDLNYLKGVPGSEFEVVDTGPIVTQAP